MKTIYDIRIGDKASISATFSDADVVLYACMTGDFNPVHIDREYAEKQALEKCTVHGTLVAGLISTVLGKLVPVPGTRVIRQNISFESPVYIGETVTASAKVTLCNVHGNQVLVSVRCEGLRGDAVIQGDVLMELPDMISVKRQRENQGVHVHA